MTKQEFIAKRAAALRQRRIVAWPELGLCLALTAGSVRLYQWVAPQWNGRSPSETLAMVVVFGTPLMCVGALPLDQSTSHSAFRVAVPILW
jgi:hypothetical protein